MARCSYTRIDGRSAAIVVLLLGALAAGWALMTLRINERTGGVVSEGRTAAAETWGASVSQESPRIVVAGSPEVVVPLTSESGKVDLAMDYRKRGLVYLAFYSPYGSCLLS